MEQKFTYKKWPCIFLLLMLIIQYAQAQYPKFLTKYPVVLGAGGINSLTQKGNVIYMGGNFTNIGAEPLANGVVFDQIGANAPNPNFVRPNSDPNGVAISVSQAISDGTGGFYISGAFTKVGNVDRPAGIARINADGSLNDWNPTVDLNGGSLSLVATTGNIVIGFGNFASIGNQTYQNVNQFVAIDAATNQPLPGWTNLVIPGMTTTSRVLKVIESSNKLYVLATPTVTGASVILQTIDITDINNPIAAGTFQLDALSSSGAALPIIDFAVSGNTVYLSGWSFNSAASHAYDAQTASGQVFNGALFAVDGTTGQFIKSFSTSIQPTDVVGSLAINGNKLYMAYSTDIGDGIPDGGKLAAFDLPTGNDVSSSLPPITMTNTVPPTLNVRSKIPTANFSKLLVTADHQLIIYGGGFITLNTVNQTVAAIDLSTNTLKTWNPTVLSPDNSTVAFPNTVSESNGKIYLGGGIAVPSTTYARNGLAAINSSTGEVLPWAPTDFSGTINTMSVIGNTLYVGGAFSGSKNNLAAYDITDPNNPTLKTDFTPNPDATVSALNFNGNTLFAAGDFQNINGTARKRLAAFDISSGSGTLTPWNPGANQQVNALTVLNNVLYAGGFFTKIGTTTRSLAAAFDFSTSGNGALTAWNPQISLNNSGFQVNTITAQPADGTNHAARVFIGGYFYQIGAASTPVINFAVTNTTDGALDAWQLPNGFGQSGSIVNGLAISSNKLYAGGVSFFNSADISNNFAQIDATNYLYGAANPTSIGKNVNSILPSSNILFIGGTFGGLNQPALDDPNLVGFAAFQTGDLTPVITFADMTNTYGDAPFSPAATSTVTTNPITYSIATGDNPDNVISLASVKITILKPGVATITASQTGAADVKAKITISKAALTVVPKDATSVVNQAFPDFPFTLTGWKNGDDTKSGIFTGKPVFASTGTPSSPAGTYDLTVSGAGTLTSDYYTFTPSTAKATLTINTTGSTAQTITFAALPAKTYGDADITLGATTSASGLSVTYKSSDDNIATITGNKLHIAGAGTVTITASQPGDPTYAPAADVPQTFTIGKAALTIKADNKTINRGDQLPAFTATYTGLVNGDAATDLDTPPAFSTTATQSSAPGPYPITAADAASDNYDITYVAGTLTIKGTQIITFAPVSTLTYGDAAFDPGATSDAGASFKPVYTTSNPSVIAISGGQAVIKGAGTATITATFAAANGFDLTTATENITVQPKALTATADNKTKNFGDPLPAFTITYNGFVNSDTYITPGVFSTPPVAATTATATSPAGTYPITVGGGVSTNYTLSYFPGALTVIPVARTITFNALPNKTYGDADFNPGATSNTNEQATYTVADPTVATVTGNQIHITGAGSTTITATFPANSGYTGATTATQTLTIAKTKLTITADNLTKTQGPPDITLTASYSGFVNNDNQLNLTTRPTLTTTANVNSPTGTYPITVSGASSPNYDITYVNGTLSIIFGVGQDQIVVHPMLSPNGDGKNDFMLIDGIQNYPDNHVVVVDRNGAKVYEAKGYDNSSIVFAGKNNSGNSLVAGTYYYEINYTLKGNVQHKAGYIIIKY